MTKECYRNHTGYLLGWAWTLPLSCSCLLYPALPGLQSYPYAGFTDITIEVLFFPLGGKWALDRSEKRV